ncbi:glycosyltransferase family 2 protein [Candidatus Nitrosopumilus sediminis]|uniref:Glycosyltransferases involved in cell wall biogenesis n=1 Tax=Candidatus Nitrosopumilus sediminis TaxID=1229909 RepID=K0BEM5_9ARCH|nr:glycosyltransferase family 2 protein [Candidatus Nitrosopumilus sediminis]AFS83495.1 Glycosyltransferases involved in cell wall biogenesis [Candidatus Nitrosopumilus sediminis]
MKLACIPAYNEESHIEFLVKSAMNHVDSVIVCDDGSTDNTAKIAKKAGAVVISHKTNKGYGAAIISLFEYARNNNAETMITLDGDGQHNPDQIPLLLNTITQHNVDVVIGSRFLNQNTEAPGYRQRGIKIITSAANYGADLKVTDSQSGFRAYSKDAIDAIHPTEEGMAVSTEILLKISNKGLSLAEIPITISYEGDTSEHNPLSHGLSVLANTIKYISIKHPLKFYGIPGVALIIAGIIIGGIFLDAYLNKQAVFYGSLLGSVVMFLLGAILSVTSIILFSMANLIRDRY